MTNEPRPTMCRECKWLDRVLCENEKAWIEVPLYYEGPIEYQMLPEQINPNDDCPHFEAKKP